MININRQKMRIINIAFVIIFLSVWLISLKDLSKLPSSYKSCAILPIVFLIGYCTYFFVRKKKVIDIHMVILLLFFVKMYIIPELVIYCGGFNLTKFNPSLKDNIGDAVFIQCLEWLSVVVGLCVIRSNGVESVSFDRNVEKITNRKVWWFIGLSVGVMIVSIIRYPSLLYKFRPIFFTNETAEILWKQKSTIAVSSINGLIYYPLNWLLSITRLTFVYYLTISVWKKRRGKSDSVSLVLSALIIVVGLVLVVPDAVAVSIISALSLLLMLVKLYPNKRKMITKVTLSAAAGLFIYVFFGRAIVGDSTIVNSLSVLSGKLNAYFSGFINTAAAVDMNCQDKIDYFAGDFLRSFPIIKGFFVKFPRTTELFNYTLGYDTIYNSQIIPLEGQAYFYFSYLGVIVIPLIVVKICMHLYSKMQKAKGTYDYFVYCFFSLLFAFGIVMYDGFLIFSLALGCLPLWLIIIFINKRRKMERHERTFLFR